MDTSSSWDEPSRGSRDSGSGWGNQHKSGRFNPRNEHKGTFTYIHFALISIHGHKHFLLASVLKQKPLQLPILLIFSTLSLCVTLGPKPMETWCGEEVSMGNSWDQEEEVEIGMWSNSQQDNRSNDQNTWNYKNKGSYKVC